MHLLQYIYVSYMIFCLDMCGLRKLERAGEGMSLLRPYLFLFFHIHVIIHTMEKFVLFWNGGSNEPVKRCSALL